MQTIAFLLTQSLEITSIVYQKSSFRLNTPQKNEPANNYHILSLYGNVQYMKDITQINHWVVFLTTLRRKQI
jgi:hypothetical protein